MGELRESKKRETRQRISDIATGLFYARGFDAVTVEEIAAAANVSKMTVFNYFARKEDLLLDREDEVMLLLREALGERPKGQSPIDALRRLVDRLCEQRHPFARVDSQTVGFWRVVAASPSLRARVREIGDETVDGLAVELAGPKPDGLARLVAGMIVLTWRTAYGEAIRVFERGGSAKKANAAFIALIDRGFAAVHAMAASSIQPGPHDDAARSA
ncbi:MAG TPA: TetR/AcrR family transcriptional regulator [Sorangium sp.]|nr:TetR/AcrR family transcriptional regulator [Sorangium sp.]